jgi:hypothetical protein
LQHPCMNSESCNITWPVAFGELAALLPTARIVGTIAVALPRRSRAARSANQPARGGVGGMVEIGFYQIGNELPRLAFGVQRRWRFHPVTSVAPRSQCCNQRAARLARCRWLPGLGIPKIFGIWPPLAPPPVTESSNNHGTMSYRQGKPRRMMRKSKLSKKQRSESARRASLARWGKKER